MLLQEYIAQLPSAVKYPELPIHLFKVTLTLEDLKAFQRKYPKVDWLQYFEVLPGNKLKFKFNHSWNTVELPEWDTLFEIIVTKLNSSREYRLGKSIARLFKVPVNTVELAIVLYNLTH